MTTKVFAIIGFLVAVGISTSAESRPRGHKKIQTIYSENMGNRPSGCPARAWCGCYLAKRYGYSGAKARPLWLARAWPSHFARAPLAPGNVAVFARGRRGGHVGEIVAVHGSTIMLTSGNDGGAVRTRERSTRGLIAVVNPHAPIQQWGATPSRGKPHRERRDNLPIFADRHAVV